MTRKPMMAAFVAGPRNLTRVTNAVPETDAGYDILARAVRVKAPTGCYEVYEVKDGVRGWRRVGDSLAHWHYGDGFEFQEGWWVS